MIRSHRFPLRHPKFDPRHRSHIRLCELSEKAHEKVKRGTTIDDIDGEIDENVRKLWNIGS